MPMSTYETLPDTVLDYKKKHGIGRFDPAAAEKQEQKANNMWADVDTRGKLARSCAMFDEAYARSGH